MQYDFEFRSRRSNVISTHGMVASSQPLATLAGLDILRSGGTAADAAVAVAAALNVVEPFSTGVGGDCFALYWHAAEKRVYALNGSGPAAAASTIDEIKQAGFHRYPLFTGHAVSVPGTVGGWSALLSRFGKMQLADVLAPAIKYALEGYPVTEWIGADWQLIANQLQRDKVDDSLPKHQQRIGPRQASAEEFLIEGRAPEIGEIILLRTLGETLLKIANHGKEYFYQGEFAHQICNYVQKYGGWLEPSDLMDFEAEWVEPIYANYRNVRLYECPPNGQGLAAIMAVKIANGFDLAGMDQIERTHILIECMRLGFAEALQWVSDPKFSDIPLEQLLSDDYTRERRNMINRETSIKHLRSGIQPVGDDTVYLSVIDEQGNACSFINSIYMIGGTGLIVPGIGVLLHNRAALFSLDPEHPNALEGGKRPYHTIIPAMLTQDDELYASFGVKGGFMQPQGHLQVLSNLIDRQHNPQQALDMPRFRLNIDLSEGVGADEPGGEVYLEEGFTFEEAAALRRKGHHISPISGVQRRVFGIGQIILRDPATGVLTAGSDPRKDGCAMGY